MFQQLFSFIEFVNAAFELLSNINNISQAVAVNALPGVVFLFLFVFVFNFNFNFNVNINVGKGKVEKGEEENDKNTLG